jgi:glycosyltransferase involved in cell wall biosynthesis
MKISVIIPTYNSSVTIGATIDSVLRQTLPPHEVLVLDDGSTDSTVSLLKSYEPKITVLQQKNRGVANARNSLCKRATGDLVAFLDHDDLWHPAYLETQRKLYESYPNAAAFVTGHLNFRGWSDYQWETDPLGTGTDVELIEPLNFFKRYNQATGPFASMSYCCVPKRVLEQMGDNPFCVSGVDDSYFFSLVVLYGSVVYAVAPLVAYRITDRAQSVDRLKSFALWVNVFQLLEERYRRLDDVKFSAAFKTAFASKRRSYSKILMGVGKVSEAREQIRHSLGTDNNPMSLVKSLGLLVSTYMPKAFQPRWPTHHRE